MGNVFLLFLLLSIAGSISAIILFVLKLFYKDKITKTWQYYLWLVIVLRFITPFYLSSHITENLFQPKIAFENQETELTKPMLPASSQPYPVELKERNETNLKENSYVASKESPEATDGIDLGILIDGWNYMTGYLAILWITIAMVLFLRKLFNYYNYVHAVALSSNVCQDTELLFVYSTACDEMGIKNPPPIYTNNFIQVPMVVGFLHPFLALPNAVVKKSELQYILHHELIHYKRKDIWYKWLLQLAVCLHWFNPLIYLISNEIERNCELSCDEAVIRKLDTNERVHYGELLLASVNTGNSYDNIDPSIMFSKNAKLLKERLGAIMSYKKNSKLNIIISTVVLITLCFSLTYTSAYAAIGLKKSSDTEYKKVATTEKSIELPRTTAIEEVILTAKNSDIFIRKASGESFKMDYNKQLYQVDYNREGNTLVINTTDLNKEDDRNADPIILYIPEANLSNIVINNNYSRIELQDFNVNLKIKSKGCSMRVFLPNNFNKSLELNDDKYSCLQLFFDKKYIDYKLRINAESSPINLPKGFPACKNDIKGYEYKNGNGKADIKIDVKSGFFSVNFYSKNSEYLSYWDYGITVVEEDGKEVLYYYGLPVRIFNVMNNRKDNSFELSYTNLEDGMIDIEAQKDKSGEITGITYISEEKVKELLSDMDYDMDIFYYYNPDTKQDTKSEDSEDVKPARISKSELPKELEGWIDDKSEVSVDVKPVRISKSELPKELESWIDDCNSKKNLYVTLYKNKYYVYCNFITNDYAWEPYVKSDGTIVLNIKDIGSKKKSASKRYALIVVPMNKSKTLMAYYGGHITACSNE